VTNLDADASRISFVDMGFQRLHYQPNDYRTHPGIT
jgi:hypothetical protein